MVRLSFVVVENRAIGIIVGLNEQRRMVTGGVGRGKLPDLGRLVGLPRTIFQSRTTRNEFWDFIKGKDNSLSVPFSHRNSGTY